MWNHQPAMAAMLRRAVDFFDQATWNSSGNQLEPLRPQPAFLNSQVSCWLCYPGPVLLWFDVIDKQLPFSWFSYQDSMSSLFFVKFLIVFRCFLLIMFDGWFALSYSHDHIFSVYYIHLCCSSTSLSLSMSKYYIFCITPCFIICSWVKHVFHWLNNTVHHLFRWYNLKYRGDWGDVVNPAFLSNKDQLRTIPPIPSRGLLGWPFAKPHLKSSSAPCDSCGYRRVPSGHPTGRCHGHRWGPGLHLKERQFFVRKFWCYFHDQMC